MPRPGKDEKITFQARASYWGGYQRQDEHSISPSHMVALGRKKFGLITTKNINWYGAGRTPNFEVARRKTCAIVQRTGWYSGTGYCSNSHEVPAIDVYNYCVGSLGMIEKTGVTEKIVEKIVEKIRTVEKIVEVKIERGYHGTFEKREVLSFALTRELRGTERALRQAYIDNDADASLRLAARMDVIREVMSDLTVDVVEGAPQVVVARSPMERGLFDAV